MSFWTQPSRPYRNFQLVYTLLTLNFVLPAFSYTFTPDQAIDSFLLVNDLLGGAPYDFPEADSRVWRYLAAANVMTLGFCCALLQFNLRRFYAVLVPLTFMKAYAAACWLGGFLLDPSAPLFAAAALLDAATCTAFVWFAGRAHRDIATRDDGALVPRPR